MSQKKTTISFHFEMDENHVPNAIEWHASDADERGACDAAFLTIWDKQEKNTLRIDLWTKDMMVDDMQIFFHQMLLSMSDTYMKATGDKNVGNEMKDFALKIGEMMGILKKGN